MAHHSLFATITCSHAIAGHHCDIVKTGTESWRPRTEAKPQKSPVLPRLASPTNTSRPTRAAPSPLMALRVVRGTGDVPYWLGSAKQWTTNQ